VRGGPRGGRDVHVPVAKRRRTGKGVEPSCRSPSRDPVHFTVRGQQETFLVDSDQPYGVNLRTTLIGHVERLIGTKFHADVYYG
jgi:hypothetical protein